MVVNNFDVMNEMSKPQYIHQMKRSDGQSVCAITVIPIDWQTAQAH